MLKLGMIDYLNLLPFHIFIKQYIRSTQIKSSINYHKNIPTIINKRFKYKKINEAFVSSVTLRNNNYYPVGIVANKKVKSVLVIQNKYNQKDISSASSNVLADILGIKGQVLIGDKALKYSLKQGDYIDLATAWFDRYQLPFVFAVFAYNTKNQHNKRLIKQFLKSKNIKIPMYIMKQYSIKLGISISQIKEYLTLISYELKYKEIKALKLFLKLSKN